MQKSDSSSSATTAHRRVMSSTTLNRRYVSRPAHTKTADSMMATRKTVDMSKVATRMKTRTATPTPVTQPTAQELKERAIQKALANAARPEPEEKVVKEKKTKKASKVHFGVGRIALAMCCATIAVVAIAWIVNNVMPDFSLNVVASNVGFDPKYPSYIPRDFSKSDITAQEGKVTLVFKHSGSGDMFSITEERSSWDSNALESNYVKSEFGEEYDKIREQGLTIFINNNSAAWVNGGLLYKLKCISGTLTKKQIRSIAVSL